MSAVLTRESAPPPPESKPPFRTPRLENGDHLTRAEFERRYAAMPERFQAELVEGVVNVSSPVRVEMHSEPHADMITWLGVYRAATPGVHLGDNGTVRLDVDNEVQPDAYLRIAEQSGGRARLAPDGYVEGAPELVVEVAASSASYDLHEKLNVYRRNGVQEYIVWRTEDRQLDWFQLREGKYQEILKDDVGVLSSQIFPGLRLAAAALLDGKLDLVLAELQKGIVLPEHDSFVKKFQENH